MQDDSPMMFARMSPYDLNSAGAPFSPTKQFLQQLNQLIVAKPLASIKNLIKQIE
jgi:hypothetical protein